MLTENNLERSLSFSDAVFIIIGNIIGAGIFFTPIEVISSLNSTFLIMLARLTGAVMNTAIAQFQGPVFFGAFTETAFTSTGSGYTPLKSKAAPSEPGVYCYRDMACFIITSFIIFSK